MPNLSGLGAFAEGLAGGINTGLNIANFKENQKRSALQEFHVNATVDRQVVEDFMKTAKDSPDMEGVRVLADTVLPTIKTPAYKALADGYINADSNTRKKIQDTITDINSIIGNPDRDSLDKGRLLVAKAGATYGLKSPITQAAAITQQGAEEAYSKTVTPSLIQKIVLGKSVEDRLGGKIPTTQGLLKMPGITDDELGAFNDYHKNIAELARINPTMYKNVMGDLGIGVKPDRTRLLSQDPSSPARQNFLAGEQALKPDRQDSTNQQYVEDYMQNHPNATVEQAVGSLKQLGQKPEKEPKQTWVYQGTNEEGKPVYYNSSDPTQTHVGDSKILAKPSANKGKGKVSAVDLLKDVAPGAVKIPVGAETGTYKGQKAYKLNDKFFDLSGKEIK